MNIKCFLLEDTGKMTEFIDGISSPILKRVDTSEEMIWSNAPIGAIQRAEYLEDYKEYCGLDGKSYIVKTPGGDWMIDGRASNCTMKEDNIHKCWCRHGEAPNFTVDKVGNTCAAGAGSIMMGEGKYHGFLRNGELTDC
jgi:hypothetical protein